MDTTRTVTVQEAVDRIGFGRFQKRLLGVCGVTWAADAAEVLLLGFALPSIISEFGLTPTQGGLTVTATFAGMLVGAWFWGTISDYIGRRLGFQLTVLIFAIFGLLSAFSPGWEWLAVHGPVELAGPDDPLPGVTDAAPDRLRLLLREVYAAAGGTHPDLAEYDRVMAADRRTAVLLRPERFTTNPAGAEHVEPADPDRPRHEESVR